jgi:hypothetical protein
MKKNKLNQYESKTTGEPSPEQIQQAKEWMLNRMMEVVDKLPANPAPVKESFAELARQAKFGVPRQPTIIVGDEKPPTVPAELTLFDSGGEENSGKNKFTDLELELIRQIENAE